jgi:WD40 repeat protein
MFDPYRDWLGITDERRPPNLYHLLGIAPGESNPQAIEAAASRQLARVQSFIAGAQSKEAWRIIDEIALAKTTLLDPARRAAYDAVFGTGPKQPFPAVPANQAPAPIRQTRPPAPVLETAPAARQAPYQPPPAPALRQTPSVPPAPAPTVDRPPAKKRANDFDLLADHDPPSSESLSSSESLPSVTAIARPKVKHGGSGLLMIAGGVAAIGLIAGAIYVATKNKPADNPKLEVAENEKKVAVRPPIHEDDEPKKEKTKEAPKKKPPEKKIGPPPKNDPPPPLEIAEEFKEPRTFRGHESSPKSIAISADGKQLLTTGDDLSVFSWTPDKDRPSRRMTLRSPPACGVAFLPGGKQAVAVDGGFIYVLDLANNSKKEMVTPAGGFQGMAVGKDGGHVLTCSNDGKLRWWDIAKDTPVRTISVTNGVLDCVALSADGKTAVTGSRDGTLFICDVTTGKAQKRGPTHKGGVTAVAFSPDGRHVASVGEDKLGKVWEKDLGTLLFTLPGYASAPSAVAFSADGSMLLTGGDSTLRSWDAMTGDPLRWSYKADSKVRSAAVDPKDRFVVVGLADGGMQLLLLPAVRPDTPPRGAQVQPPKQPLPTPAAGSVESALATIREKYKADYARTGADDRFALYDKLITQAKVGPQTEAARFALFQEARDLAGKMGRIDVSFRAIAARSIWFNADELADKAAALKTAGQGTIDKALTAAAIGVVEEAEKSARPDIVDELFRQRELFPQAADTPDLNARIQAADKRWIAGTAEREAMRKLAADLKKNPDTPAANAQFGKYLCFRVGNWEDGLARIAKGDDAALKELAKKDSASPRDAKGQAEIGKAWFDFAAKADDGHKPGILLRSKQWYEKAGAGDLPAADKLAIGQRLGEIAKQLTALAAVSLSRPGDAVMRRGFNSIRSHVAVESQWALAGSDGYTAAGVALAADASMTSRFRILDGSRVECSFVPDGREVKIHVGAVEAAFKPAGTDLATVAVERKGNEIKFALKSFTGSIVDEKAIPLASGKQDPATLAFEVAGPSPKAGVVMKNVVVSGPVKLSE